MQRRRWIWGILTLAFVALPVSSCGTGTLGTTPTSTTEHGAGPTTTTTTAEPVTARAAVRPDQGVAGTAFTFTVEIRGPGILDSEGVQFGDGGTSGANAGSASCGDTVRADHTSAYTHAYSRPGTYEFVDRVTVQAPPPSCAYMHTTARLTVIVGAPLSEATFNGAFVSPSKNIGCYIEETPPGSLRCATFSPPRLVTMDASGTFETCSGNQCNLGNPAMETPVLPYGSATAGGPFQCLSSEAGMICTVAGHKGFALSRAGVESIR